MSEDLKMSISRKLQQVENILHKDKWTESRKSSCVNILNKLDKDLKRYNNAQFKEKVSEYRKMLNSKFVTKGNNPKNTYVTINNRKYTQRCTQVIFFDLEFYVPKKDQISNTLAANPCKANHLLLGGTFLNYKPLKNEKNEQMEEFWIWNFKSEKALVERIVQYFEKAWNLISEEKNQTELTLCGIGISRVDIGYLYSKAMHYKVRSNDVLFRLFYNVRIIELESVGIPFYKPEHNMILSKNTKELLTLFDIPRDRKYGSSVWQNYEYKKYKKIEERNRNEVSDMFTMYKKIYAKLMNTDL